MLAEKTRLSIADLESQAAVELPSRELMALVRIGNVLSGNTIDVDVRNVNVAVQVCAAVEAINLELLTVDARKCEIVQRNNGNGHG